MLEDDIDIELPEILFSVEVPVLKCQIRTTSNYWKKICSKHPEIENSLPEVKKCLADTEIIRQSKRDEKIFLLYIQKELYWLCTVCKKLNGVGFMITSYITDKIKEGETIWQK